MDRVPHSFELIEFSREDVDGLERKFFAESFQEGIYFCMSKEHKNTRVFLLDKNQIESLRNKLTEWLEMK